MSNIVTQNKECTEEIIKKLENVNHNVWLHISDPNSEFISTILTDDILRNIIKRYYQDKSEALNYK